jgi:hypothetical protein
MHWSNISSQILQIQIIRMLLQPSQTVATDITKRARKGRDNLIYYSPDGPKTPEQFMNIVENRDLIKEDFAAKAVVSIGCGLDGNCTQPLNYYFTAAETGADVTWACDTIASKLIEKNAKTIVHVIDAGSAHRSFSKRRTIASLIHWCYVHLMKNGANHLDHGKYYPIQSMQKAVVATLQGKEYLNINAGNHTMVKSTACRDKQLPDQQIKLIVNNKHNYTIL